MGIIIFLLIAIGGWMLIPSFFWAIVVSSVVATVAAGMRANGCSHLHHGLNLVCLALCFDLQDVNV